MKYKLVEEFYTLQGEGKFAGTAAYFVRFYKCNLTCVFGDGLVCDDTAHTDKDKMYEATLDEICFNIQKSGTKHVVLTGGEVSLHDVKTLIERIKEMGVYVQIETNGTNWFNIANADYITYSPKFMFGDENAPRMTYGFHELKVLANAEHPINPEDWSSIKNKYISPIDYQDKVNMDSVAYCVQFVLDNPSWKLSLQTHKFIGVR